MFPGTGSESVMCSELCGDSRRAASARPHTVLLQTFQRSWAVASSCQHRLRLQSQSGHLLAGWFHIDTHCPELSIHTRTH